MRLFDALDNRLQYLGKLIDQSRNSGIRTYCIAVTTGCTIVRNPFRVLKPDAGHVSENSRRCRHHTQTNERIGDIVIAHSTCVEITGLLPEAMDVA